MSLKCIVCKEDKPKEAFSKKAKSKNGFASKCKKCHNDYVRNIWYPNNRKKQLESSKKWKQNNKIKLLSYKYNLPISEINLLFISSNGKCQLCDCALVKPNVDHCHQTGKVRGILCRECNLGLGFFKDNVNIIKKAAKYLERNY